MVQPTRVDYLVVGGGGGGGSGLGSGAGAGAFIEGTGFATSGGTTLDITIGAGGTGGNSGGVNGGGNGGDTILQTSGGGGSGTITCNGGAGGSSVGAAQIGYGNGNASGSGAGGGGTSSFFPGGGTDNGPGNKGAYVNGPFTNSNNGYGNASGGGGGAGGKGKAFNISYGGTIITGRSDGGDGLGRWADGTYRTYATGGGAGPYAGGLVPNAGLGGSGGGALGGDGSSSASSSPTTNQSGLANTGGGGGGAGYFSSAGTPRGKGGIGGSGVVIIRYPDIFDAASATTGSPTVTIHENYRIYKFTGSGSITF